MEPGAAIDRPNGSRQSGAQRHGAGAARSAGFRWWRELGISKLDRDNLGTATGRIRLRRVVLRDELDHKTGKEAAVEIAVVEFEPRVAIADPAFETRVDRITGNQDVGSRGQVTRKNERSIVAHRLSSLAAPAWRRASCSETAALTRCRSGDISTGVTGRAGTAAARVCASAGDCTAALNRSAAAMIVSYCRRVIDNAVASESRIYGGMRMSCI
jgi:hypothetical protein